MVELAHDRLELAARVQRVVNCTHAEAFQIMLYHSEQRVGQHAWVWNSRDGVTPFICSIDGVEHRHAMSGYPTGYSAILPDVASHVWVSYNKVFWDQLVAAEYEKLTARSDPYGAEFRVKYSSVDDWAEVREFEHGQPCLITRDDYLRITPEWAGRYAQVPA